MRRLARLAADAIDVGITVVTLPARLAAMGLRFFADHKDESARGATTGGEGDGPAGP